METNLVIVESPAKAKTINKFLGSDYKVLASYGHIRDLLAKNGSVKPDENFDMVYELSAYSKKHIDAIVSEAKKAEKILLATDPDREGEAIAWHIIEVLKEKKAIKKDCKIERIVFSEITKKAVTSALQNSRDIDMNLVMSQQARRALDYLVGFNLSPVLWRKLPGSRSAGRVQSVALRLVADRDAEIERFVTQEYWTLKGIFQTIKEQKQISSTLIQIDGKKLEKFDIENEANAKKILSELEKCEYEINKIEKKPLTRRPQPPFITSTLQQEGSRKLGFYSKKTMKVAQELYEGIKIDNELVGLITYMRTDGVQLSNDAVTQIRDYISNRFGQNYLPASANIYKSKSLNAQEAHEAIRPTNILFEPDKIKHHLTDDQYKLYDLIWKRVVACQMEASRFETTSVDIISNNQKFILRATGSIMLFDGYNKIYTEGKDDDSDEDSSTLLPMISEGEKLDVKEFIPNQHFTEPPPRYTEASFVKKLEELGIGRPSTYATIISVIQDRNYVRLDKKKFICEDRGRIVTSFLMHYFDKYVQYDYTAKLENELDDVSSGTLPRNDLLKSFWNEFKSNVDDISTKPNQEVIEYINNDLKEHFFPKTQDGNETKCPDCNHGTLSIKAGKYGVFIACSAYPECKYTRQVANEKEDDGGQQQMQTNNQEVFGQCIYTGANIYFKKGPYGYYVEMTQNDGTPKRVSIPKHINLESVNVEIASQLLSLPKDLGFYPGTENSVKVGIGKYGPFVLYNEKYYNITSGDVLKMNLQDCVEIINKKSNGESAAAIDLGNHPVSGDKIQILSGRYGPYIKYGKSNIPIPKNIAPDNVDLAKAIEIIDKKLKS